jgi:hypothetical protein
MRTEVRVVPQLQVSWAPRPGDTVGLSVKTNSEARADHGTVTADQCTREPPGYADPIYNG